MIATREVGRSEIFIIYRQAAEAVFAGKDKFGFDGRIRFGNRRAGKQRAAADLAEIAERRSSTKTLANPVLSVIRLFHI